MHLHQGNDAIILHLHQGNDAFTPRQ